MNHAQTATYKGRNYKLLWSGKTKYGNRAKLGFFDGSKEFWVDASLVTPGPARVTSGGSDWRYRQDGTPGPVRGCYECRMLGRMCKQCQFDEFDD